jgi:uncharacterized membrane protein
MPFSFSGFFDFGDLSSNAPMLHATVVHLPVALAMLGLPFILAALVLGERSVAARVLAFAAYVALAGAALLAVKTGELATRLLPGTLPERLQEAVGRHQEMAEQVVWFGAVTAAIIALGFVRARRLRLAALSVAALSGVATLLWVAQTGRLGAKLVYGDGVGAPAIVIETRMYSAQGAAAGAHATPRPETGEASSDPERGPDREALLASLPADVSYTQNVEPVFRDHCYSCHSGATPEHDLNLSSFAGVLRGGAKRGPAVIPGHPDDSPIMKHVRGEYQPRMPKGELPLSPDRVLLIEKWIAQGARESAGAPVAQERVSREAPWQRLTAELLDEPERLEQVEVRRDLRYVLTASAPEPARDNTVAPARLDRFTLFDEDALRRVTREMRVASLPPAPAPPAIGGVAHPIDAFIAGQLTAAGLEYPAEVCSDETFVRRVYLDVLGVIPSPAEIEAFVGDGGAGHRERLIDALLDQTTGYAAHWVPFWEDALCSTPNTISDPQKSKKDATLGEHGHYADWIFDSFKKNRPFDLWVSELFDARMPGHQKDYVLRWVQMEVLQSAANAAQVFLGTSMKCASCHNHFSNPEWTQSRFFELAGFFSTDDLEVVRCEKHTGRYISPKFVFDLPGMDLDAPPGLEARSARLAQLMVDPLNPRFAKTLVNRLWQRFLGEGLYEPIDDLREDRRASHPELLEWLAQDFMRNGFDVKHTMRLILTSQTYQRPFRADWVEEFAPEHPDAPRYFRSPHLRRLTAEQMLDSARKALGRAWDGDARTFRAAELSPLPLALGRAATRNEVSTKRPADPAVLQSLELMNGREFHDLVYASPVVETIGRELAAQGASRSLADRIYLGVLSRRSSDDEARTTMEYLDRARQETAFTPASNVDVPAKRVAVAARPGGAGNTVQESAAVGDVFWALFVSPEFQYNH